MGLHVTVLQAHPHPKCWREPPPACTITVLGNFPSYVRDHLIVPFLRCFFQNYFKFRVVFKVLLHSLIFFLVCIPGYTHTHAHAPGHLKFRETRRNTVTLYLNLGGGRHTQYIYMAFFAFIQDYWCNVFLAASYQCQFLAVS